MADKTIGFSIVITGTDTGIKKMGDLKRETLTYEKELEKLIRLNDLQDPKFY